ncbi:Ku protein [Streptomyces sp. NPDC058286]|uniref:Ku protein n=1 Tax=Streptomyces sp. NPDC058286 TaxID=3346422 RepID=UPI0036EF300E
MLPVKLFSATEEHHVRLREIHAADSGRVQHRQFCETEDREIPYEEVWRGWELSLGDRAVAVVTPWCSSVGGWRSVR